MTREEAKKKLSIAQKMNLVGCDNLMDLDIVARECNGIGAAWFPAWLRWMISFLCPSLVLAADIHDIQYYYGGDDIDRRKADVMFLANIVIIAESKYKYFPPMRRLVECIGFKMYRVLRLFGDKAWKEVNTDDK